MSWIAVVVVGALCALGGFLLAAVLMANGRDDRP